MSIFILLLICWQFDGYGRAFTDTASDRYRSLMQFDNLLCIVQSKTISSDSMDISGRYAVELLEDMAKMFFRNSASVVLNLYGHFIVFVEDSDAYDRVC